jgi:hypothetical protein
MYLSFLMLPLMEILQYFVYYNLINQSLDIILGTSLSSLFQTILSKVTTVLNHQLHGAMKMGLILTGMMHKVILRRNIQMRKWLFNLERFAFAIALFL